ncbi:MAG: DUF1492 domain-containing protein [Hespellia sp.]|nr:DUF1492 domain-containing protein [Hespellia sp.]
MRGTIQGCSYGEKIGTNPNRNLEAPFIRTIEKIWELEEKINVQITKLVSLQSEIDEAINQMSDPAEKLLLKYRYLHNLDWTDVAGQMAISERTVHRIHSTALANFVVPENNESWQTVS